MKISVYNPSQTVKQATANMGERFQRMTRFNEETNTVEHVVYFPDVHTAIVVPSVFIFKFAKHVERNFFLAHERNIDWMNS